MTESDWRSAWGEDRLVLLQGNGLMLPADSRQFLKTYGLPRVMIFQGCVTFEIHFGPLVADLTPYNSLVRWGDFYDADRDRSWGEQFVIGQEDFCNGSASYCVHTSRGVVTRIDCELSEPESYVNATVAFFGESLLTAARWSAEISATGNTASQDSLESLRDRLRRVDPTAFEDADCYWANLIEYLLTEEPCLLEITNDPARSKPRF